MTQEEVAAQDPNFITPEEKGVIPSTSDSNADTITPNSTVAPKKPRKPLPTSPYTRLRQPLENTPKTASPSPLKCLDDSSTKVDSSSTQTAGNENESDENLVPLYSIREDAHPDVRDEMVKIENEAYKPLLRSGACGKQGDYRYTMEDFHVCIDDLASYVGEKLHVEGPVGLYAIFDGHCGSRAAEFARDNVAKFLVSDRHFEDDIAMALESMFDRLDMAMARAGILSDGCCAIVAVVKGCHLFVANAGDCRAVLARAGRAVDLSNDHKADGKHEQARIANAKGSVDGQGYLSGVLNVTRALGDWRFKYPGKWCVKGLVSEPEVQVLDVGYEDDFLILGCDGFFDVMSSSLAHEMVRRCIRRGESLEKTAEMLVDVAHCWESEDNVTVVVVRFQRFLPPRRRTEVTTDFSLLDPAERFEDFNDPKVIEWFNRDDYK